MELALPTLQRWSDLDRVQRNQLLRRPDHHARATVSAQAKEIVNQVRDFGDSAVVEFSHRFDSYDLKEFAVSADAMELALESIDPDLRRAIRAASQNIEAFHAAQLAEDLCLETVPGVICERIWQPLDSVGFYIPGGSAPLISTIMMLAIPARLAGCTQRIMCTPAAQDGTVDASILACARLCNVQQVYAVGGAQAIAAMAYGTETVPRVRKIFGPGNQWVTAAKTRVAQDPDAAAIDMPAGPSELVVIASAEANPDFVAADLLSQAEHGPDSQVLLLTDSADLVARVGQAIVIQAGVLSRRDIIAQSMANAVFLLTEDLAAAVSVANQYAPEHLILNVAEPRALLRRVRNAGSVFLGDQAPESVGDYCSGTNHVLPTAGWARSFSGISVNDFRRSMTVQTLSAEGLEKIGPVAQQLAGVEGLDAHANAVAVRLSQSKKEAVA